MVAKFYRPGRWSDAAIRRGACLCLELADQEIPVVAPLARGGELCTFITAFATPFFRAAAAAGRSSATPRSASGSGASWAAFMRSAAPRRFRERARLNIEDLGRRARDFVLDGDWMPDYLGRQIRGSDR